MSDMTDLEISKALALAIGWKKKQIGHGILYIEQCIGIPERLAPDSGESRVFYDDVNGNGWCVLFDYMDWNVIGPIAERYSAFPSSVSSGNFRKAKKQGYTDVAGWEVSMFDYKNGKEQSGKWHSTFASTPQKAIALAVIGAAT